MYCGWRRTNEFSIFVADHKVTLCFDAAVHCSSVHLDRLRRRTVCWQRGCSAKWPLNPSCFLLLDLFFIASTWTASSELLMRRTIYGTVRLLQRNGQFRRCSLKCTIIWTLHQTIFAYRAAKAQWWMTLQPSSVTDSSSDDGSLLTFNACFLSSLLYLKLKELRCDERLHTGAFKGIGPVNNFSLTPWLFSISKIRSTSIVKF